MVKVSNNEVAKKLAKNEKVEREQFFDHVKRIHAPKESIVQSGLSKWAGHPEAVLGKMWDFEALGIPELWVKYGIRGQGANVTVVDSGVNELHPQLSHVKGFSFDTLLNNASRSMIPSDPTAGKDMNGQGTWVCGKIAGTNVGIAPRCTLSSLKVLDEHVNGTMENATTALKYLTTDSQVNLVTLCFGSPVQSAEQEKLIKRLADAGVIVLAAYYRFDGDSPCYPAAYKGCLAVSTSPRKDALVDENQIDIADENASAYSLHMGHQYRRMQGASMGVGVVAGILTLGISYLKIVKQIESRKEISKAVLSAFLATAKDASHRGKNKTTGFANIDMVAFFERLAK